MLTKKDVEHFAVTREWVIEMLVANVERAMEPTALLDRRGIPNGQYRYDGSVANKALELLGKELGMFKGIEPGDPTADNEVADVVRSLQKMSPVERIRRVATMIQDAAREHDKTSDLGAILHDIPGLKL